MHRAVSHQRGASKLRSCLSRTLPTVAVTARGRWLPRLPALLLASCLGGLSVSCAGLGGPSHLRLDPADRAATGARGPVRLLRTPSLAAVSIAEAADVLADADVVFLGEQHDSGEGHAVQLALTKALAERRGEIILSMEMFERDAQRRLDLYLDGTIDEAHFLAGARPWGNYAQHYRGAVEFARENGFEVVAANVYRPIASRVARGGLAQGIGDAWAARNVDTSDGEYKRRFYALMPDSNGISDERRAAGFAAQCIKDDTMAESIAEAMRRRGETPPLVIHWNGRFHSDFGLGTVERLHSRIEGLNIAVVSMLTTGNVDRAITDEERDQGHFLIVAPTPASRR